MYSSRNTASDYLAGYWYFCPNIRQCLVEWGHPYFDAFRTYILWGSLTASDEANWVPRQSMLHFWSDFIYIMRSYRLSKKCTKVRQHKWHSRHLHLSYLTVLNFLNIALNIKRFSPFALDLTRVDGNIFSAMTVVTLPNLTGSYDSCFVFFPAKMQYMQGALRVGFNMRKNTQKVQ